MLKGGATSIRHHAADNLAHGEPARVPTEKLGDSTGQFKELSGWLVAGWELTPLAASESCAER